MLTKRLIRAKNDFHSGDHLAAPIVKDLESALLSVISKEAEGAKIRSKARSPLVLSFNKNKNVLRKIFWNCLLIRMVLKNLHRKI